MHERDTFQRIQDLRTQWDNIRRIREQNQEIRRKKDLKRSTESVYQFAKVIRPKLEEIADKDPQIAKLPKEKKNISVLLGKGLSHLIGGIELVWGEKIFPTSEDHELIGSYRLLKAESLIPTLNRRRKKAIEKELDLLGRTELVIIDGKILAVSILKDVNEIDFSARVMGDVPRRSYSYHEVLQGALIPALSQSLLNPLPIRLSLTLDQFFSSEGRRQIIDNTVKLHGF